MNLEPLFGWWTGSILQLSIVAFIIVLIAVIAIASRRGEKDTQHPAFREHARKHLDRADDARIDQILRAADADQKRRRVRAGDVA